MNMQIAFAGRNLNSCFNSKDQTKFEYQHDIVYLVIVQIVFGTTLMKLPEDCLTESLKTEAGITNHICYVIMKM